MTMDECSLALTKVDRSKERVINYYSAMTLIAWARCFVHDKLYYFRPYTLTWNFHVMAPRLSVFYGTRTVPDR